MGFRFQVRRVVVTTQGESELEQIDIGVFARKPHGKRRVD